METQQDLNPNVREIKAIIEEFKGKPISNDLLLAYCNRRGFKPISVGEFQDWEYQYDTDKRLETVIPAILAIVAKFRANPELESVEERAKIDHHNENLQYEICEVFENNGVLYQEVELITKNLITAVQAMINSAGNRASNMAAVVFSDLAKKEFGEPLTIKKLSDAFKKTHNIKADKKKKTGDK